MSLLSKIILKLKIEKQFLFEQKWGIKKPSDPIAISKSILKKYLPANAVIIDCGAHVGADSIELSKIFPRATIYSFEPIPSIFKQLKNNSRRRKNVYCQQLALSNKNGTAKMFVSSGLSDASSSLLAPTGHLTDHPQVHFVNTVEVSIITLDSWAEKNSIEQVDFLWLDMQGFEFQMLKASSKILPKVKLIHTEVSTRETYKDAVLYSDLKSWLKTQGFDVVIEAIPGNTDMGNVLFVRR